MTNTYFNLKIFFLTLFLLGSPLVLASSALTSSKDIIRKKGIFETQDGLDIYYNHYIVKDQKYTKDVFVFIQGRNEYISQFQEAAHYFRNKSETDVFMYDVRGQGHSGGKRCHVDSFDEHIADLKSIITRLKKYYKNIHLISHSTGGLIAALFAAKYPNMLGDKGTLTLGSPYLALNNPFHERVVAAGISMFMSRTNYTSQFHVPTGGTSEFIKNQLTTCREYFEKYVGEKNINRGRKCGPPTWGWLHASRMAQYELQHIKGSIKAPTLVLTAGEDSIVDSDTAHNFCEDLQKMGKKCEYSQYAGAKHVLYHDKDRLNIFRTIKKFHNRYGK